MAHPFAPAAESITPVFEAGRTGVAINFPLSAESWAGLQEPETPGAKLTSSRMVTYRPRIGRFGSTGAALAHARGKRSRSNVYFPAIVTTTRHCKIATAIDRKS